MARIVPTTVTYFKGASRTVRRATCAIEDGVTTMYDLRIMIALRQGVDAKDIALIKIGDK